MSYDELELDRLGDEKSALFFLISDTDTTYNFLVALAFSQMFNLLCERADNKYGGRLPHHVRVLWDVGVKFQTVLYRTAADYEGVISVENEAAEDAPALVYWVTGASAASLIVSAYRFAPPETLKSRNRFFCPVTTS